MYVSLKFGLYFSPLM